MNALFARIRLAHLIGLLTVALVGLTAAALIVVVSFQVQADATRTAIRFQNAAMRIDASILQGQFGDALVDWTPDGNVKKVTLDQLPEASANDLVDQMARVSGQAATLFTYDAASDDFVRAATSIRKSDGTRATGTKLGHDSQAWSDVRAGRTYIGKARILGKPYYTIYQPVVNTQGKVIGILFSGIAAHDISGAAARLMVKISLMGVALILLFAAAAFFASQRLMAPLQRLEQSVVAIADGRYDMQAPYIDWRNEIGSMARALEQFRVQGVERLRLTEARAQDEAGKAERQRRLESLVVAFQAEIAQALDGVAAASDDILTASDTLSRASQHTADNAARAGQAAFDASDNVQTVASATEELTASIHDIGEQVTRANAAVNDATRVTSDTNAKVASLAEAAGRIGEVVGLIQAVAAQTNLLALNATIEAARAGEAGKGFAVVASEVKSLAQQTAKATADISAQIAAIQSSTQATVAAIGDITGAMADVTAFTSAIAAAVTQQGAATQDISRNVASASGGAQSVSDTVARMQSETAHTAQAAGQVAQASREISERNARIRTLIATFLSEADAA